jgi:antitoxin component YwqK of YwqJK toxin-antitoxin module
MKFVFLILLGFFAACNNSKVKVVSEAYENAKPKTIRYFSSKKDSKEIISVSHSSGIGKVNKPLSFLEEGYYENGNLKYRGRYIKGQTSGLWEYFYETNIAEAKCYYENNKSTDTVLCWFPSGKLKRHMVEIDTARNYWHNIDYYENGKINIDCYQINDGADNFILNGLFQEWYDNGKPKFKATFKDGWTVGKWMEFEVNGKLKEESDKSFSISLK